ncbi:MAG TPA: hypothetical protein VFJ97_16140 [Dermatophilaceae bacterium]|nr:hypothetical protein [Dermatophilaceae bacterium]
MSTPTQQYTDMVQQSQQAVLNAVDTWTKTVQEAFAQLPSSPGQFDASGMVDQVFDFTEKVLEVQRDLAKRLVSTSAATAEKLASTSPSDATATE